ncbi:hypothetical protein [Riemerella columbina]|uniref:hypothetical protein n=1 Tax=Riemerella columbina TaxID=103810 RepID=UPI0003772995|nr:hypothetical protein [Riemerella columbina]
MKKILSIALLSAFTIVLGQETPKKKACCSTKDKKECTTQKGKEEKKACCKTKEAKATEKKACCKTKKEKKS